MNSNDQPQPEPQATALAPQASFEDLKPAAPRRPWFTATRILILTNLVVFAFTIQEMGWDAFLKNSIGKRFDSAPLLKMGSNYGPLTLGGDYWRAVTAMFLHQNFEHLFFNMLFLWLFGRALDRLFDTRKALVIFLLCGIAAALATMTWNPMVNTCGSSSAVYGQAGVLVMLLAFARLDWSRRDKIKILVWMAFLTPFDVLSGHLSEDINYVGHAGGFVGGLVIGALLLWTFRMPQPQRTGRQWRFFAFVLEGLVVLFATVVQLRSDVVKQYREGQALRLAQPFPSVQKSKVKKVFINVKGSPRAAHRLEGFLKLEMEDAGIQTANSEGDADAVIGGEINVEIEHANIYFGVLQMQITADSHIEKTESCEAISTGEDGELFSSAAENAVQAIRKKYPKAQTISLDPASNTRASKEFGLQLPGELKGSNFTITASRSADLVLRFDLERRKAPLEESVVAYKIRILTPNGALIWDTSGSDVLSAKPEGDPPAVCPNRFSDFAWMQHKDAFFSVANGLVKNIQDNNGPAAASK